ncbi:MAG: hypothetical protein GY869_28665 [Planctomycetes bacterium]|nr:hypothetical protein [Planctomycetota bacterium]
MRNRVVILVLAGLLVGIAGDAWGQEKIDEISTRLIREYTTRPEFLSPLVDYMPESETVPSPRDFLGYVAGAPKKLTYSRDIMSYFNELDQSSDRLTMKPAGPTNEGRRRYYVIIADEDTLSFIEEYQNFMHTLADPRKVSDQEAIATILKAKPIYLLTGGLHSPETGSPEVLMELAYRLIVSEDPRIKSIRENLITLIIPVLEVDGREKQVDWYYRHTINATDWEDMPPTSPPYWGQYTLHDNNREGIQVSQPLTKQMYKVFFDYLPVVSLDLHESVPLLYISMGTGPYNPNIDPIGITEFQLLAQYEMSELTKFGMPGVWTWGFYTGWYPGYLLWITNNHNTTGRFYETWGNAGANTFKRKLTGTYANKDIMTRQWYRPVPPPDKELEWSFRNNINYMQSGVLSGLYYVSQNGRQFLENFWVKSKNAVKRGQQEAPHAFLAPAGQQQKYMLEYLLNQLNTHGIEVHTLTSNYAYDGENYPAGTYVVRLDQPYGPMAKNLLEKQIFPEDAEYRPYDDLAWTLGLQYGVQTVQVDDEAILSASMNQMSFPYDVVIDIQGNPRGSYTIVPNFGSPSLISMFYDLAKYRVFTVDKRFTAEGKTYPAGSLIIPAPTEPIEDLAEDMAPGDSFNDEVPANIPGNQVRADIQVLAEKYCLDVVTVSQRPAVEQRLLTRPKIGIYHSWLNTQDSGWLRFAIEQYGIDYTLINDDVLRAGNLNSKFDMLIIPELGRGSEISRFIHSVDDKFSPLAYTKTDEFPNHGKVDSTDDMTRGMGFIGLNNLESFVLEGGLLVTLGGGSGPIVELGMVPGITRVNPATLNVVNPGSFVRTKILQPTSPITFGYQETTHVFTRLGPIFDVRFKDRNMIVMQYGTSEAKDFPDEHARDEDICLSGLVQEAEQLIQSPAILNVSREKGRIIIFNFNPAHRYLNHHDFGFLFNTIMHWNALN